MHRNTLTEAASVRLVGYSFEPTARTETYERRARTQTQSESNSTYWFEDTKKIALQASKGELRFVFCAALRSKSKELGREG